MGAVVTAPSGHSGPGSDIGIFGLAALLALLVIVPVWLVDGLNSIDYPAHFVRVSLLSQLPLAPPVSDFWRVSDRLVANLALDAFVPLVAPVIGSKAGFDLFVSLALAMLIFAPVLISRALYGQARLESLAGVFFACNGSFAGGFYNFVFGSGLALLAFALWLGRRSRPVWFLVLMSAVAVLLLFCHLMALALLVLLVAAAEFGRWRQAGFPAATPPRLAAEAGAILLPALLLWHFVLERSVPTPLTFLMADNVTAIFLLSSWFGDFANWLPAALMIAVLVVARWKQIPTFPAAFTPVPVVTAFAMLLAPYEGFGGSAIHFRLPAVLCLLVVAGWALPLAVRTGRLLAGGIIAATVVLSVMQYRAWVAQDMIVRDFRIRAAAVIPEGARVLQAYVGPHRSRLTHLTDYLVLDRKAFVPDLFTTPGQSTMRLTETTQPIGAATAKEGGQLYLPDALALVGASWDALPEEQRLAQRPYRRWQCDFDWLVILGPEAEIPPLPDFIAITDRGNGVAMARIARQLAPHCPG